MATCNGIVCIIVNVIISLLSVHEDSFDLPVHCSLLFNCCVAVSVLAGQLLTLIVMHFKRVMGITFSIEISPILN